MRHYYAARHAYYWDYTDDIINVFSFTRKSDRDEFVRDGGENELILFDPDKISAISQDDLVKYNVPILVGDSIKVNRCIGYVDNV